jgi:LPS sulfotransferase NodH
MDSPPLRGYVICSEHRSGSTLLCHWLKSTGRLGNPREFLSDNVLSKRLERNPQLLETLLHEAMTPNGVYGWKVFSQQFDVSSKAQWAERLPNLRFIHLERRDLLGQAISLVRALQTKQFMAHQPALGEPRYDRRAIARHVAFLADAQARWRRFFARNGIKPLSIVYEEMLGDPAATVEAVAELVDIAKPLDFTPAMGELNIQRDELSHEWRARFVRDMKDLGYLDNTHGKARVWLRRCARDMWYFTHARSQHSR